MGRARKAPAYSSHHLDIYDADIYLATTAKQWRALVRVGVPVDKKTPEAAGLFMFAVHTQPAGKGCSIPVVVLWVNVEQHSDAAELVNTCAHEASHATDALLEHLGHTSSSTDETRAYLAGWLTAWVWGQMPVSARVKGA